MCVCNYDRTRVSTEVTYPGMGISFWLLARGARVGREPRPVVVPAPRERHRRHPVPVHHRRRAARRRRRGGSAAQRLRPAAGGVEDRPRVSIIM